MVSYEQIKTWLGEKQNRQKMVYVFCFILVFIIGFGTGRFDKQYLHPPVAAQLNYTIKPAPNQAAAQKTGAVNKAAQILGTSTPASCLIKGNINAKGYKIYHVPGGMYYKIVKPEQCFATEGDALAAGFVKSSR